MIKILRYAKPLNQWIPCGECVTEFVAEAIVYRESRNGDWVQAVNVKSGRVIWDSIRDDFVEPILEC